MTTPPLTEQIELHRDRMWRREENAALKNRKPDPSASHSDPSASHSGPTPGSFFASVPDFGKPLSRVIVEVLEVVTGTAGKKASVMNEF